MEDKEALLQQYLDITKKMVEAFKQGKEDDVPDLLEQREGFILQINKLDEAAGTIIMNTTIKKLLTEVMNFEKEIQKEFKQTLVKLANRIRATQNEQYLSKQYEEMIPVTKGVFYDQRK